MAVERTFDITAAERSIVRALMHWHLPRVTAWVYGSRANRTSNPRSDLDMVVFSTPEQRRHVADLREEFEESNLPFRVDLFVWDEVPESFKAQIEAHHVAITTEPKGADCGGPES